jgi:hypothetical protein
LIKKAMKIFRDYKDFFTEIGNTTKFVSRFFTLRVPKMGEFLSQCFQIGYKSLPLIGLTGFIMGLVLTLQLRPSLILYGVESQFPVMVRIAIVREIGPVITALIFAGKIGSSIGAELGSMKVTEQIDAMEVSGINPFNYLVVNRILAATLMLPYFRMRSLCSEPISVLALIQLPALRCSLTRYSKALPFLIYGANFELRSRFSNTNGLRKGNNVLYAGIQVGTVKDILLVNDTTIEVLLLIDDKWIGFINNSAIVSVSNEGLMGNKIIQIQPHGAGKPVKTKCPIGYVKRQEDSGSINEEHGAY